MRKKLVLLMILAAALMALPALAQSFGANPTEQPNAAFQSTSTLSGSGSQYSANPTLNNDGTASYEGATYSSSPNKGPRRAKMEDPITPDPSSIVPLGDAVLPLLLLACAYLIVRATRKRAHAMKG